MNKIFSGAKRSVSPFNKRPILFIVGFIFIVVTLIDVASANIFRIIKGYPWPRGEVDRIYRIRSPIYHHDLAQNVSIDNAVWRKRIYKIRTNSLGFRDSAVRDISLAKKDYRIVFMGDSITEGIGVEYEDTFIGITDRELSKYGIEILNAAVSGYSPKHYWRKMEYLINEKGLELDRLFVFIDISDPKNELEYYEDNKGRIGSHLQDKMRMKWLIRDNTIVLYAVLDKLHDMIFKDGAYENRFANFDYCKWTVDQDEYKEFEKGIAECKVYMDRIYRLLADKGIKMTVVVYPWSAQILYDTVDSIQVRIWKEWCRERNVAFINLFPYFLTGDSEDEKMALIEKYYIANDIHFNKSGHRLIASALIESIPEMADPLLAPDTLPYNEDALPITQ